MVGGGLRVLTAGVGGINQRSGMDLAIRYRWINSISSFISSFL
jgi:hypothetical protein